MCCGPQILPETSEPPAKRPRKEGAAASEGDTGVSAASNLGLRDTNQVKTAVGSHATDWTFGVAIHAHMDLPFMHTFTSHFESW